MNNYSLRLSPYLKKLIKKSPAVARQFLPDPLECNLEGDELTSPGIIETGVPGLERIYPDRVVIMPVNQCPAHCRFCFRKYYDKTEVMSYGQIDNAIKYINKDKRIKSVLITGGDPLMDLKRLEYIIKNVRKIRHIEDIRVGTRSVCYDPDRITPALIKMLLKYHNLSKSQPIEIAAHFNHPDEITPESKKAITSLTKASIRVYNQTVLLKGINDDAQILADLWRKLRLLGVEIYYLFHCEPVKGVGHFRTTIQKGIDIKKQIGAIATGRILPAYIVSTQIGKVEIGVDGFIEKKEGHYVWIKTPYNIKAIRLMDPHYKLPKKICRLDKQGFISTKYLDGNR